MTYLMYHELDIPGRQLCQDFKGHVPYAVPQSEFRRQLSYLQNRGWRGMSVGESLSNLGQTDAGVAITFDDGSETDLIGAAPILKEAGFGATFYIVAGWSQRSGYLSISQLRELAELKFEIGCHSMNHRFLAGLRDEELRIEMMDSKTHLEQILGVPVEHFSCPGGFWSERVARVANQSGYRSVVTSRTGINTERTDPFRLTRVGMTRGIALGDFGRLCEGKGLFARHAKEAILSVPKSLLGADSYVKLHALLHRNQ